jgi:hypothetical protein
MIDLWQTKDLQHLLALLIHLEGIGVTEQPAIKAVLQRGIDERLMLPRQLNVRSRRSAETLAQHISCSACGSTAVLIAPVNITRCTAIGGRWKSATECQEAACRHVEYSEQTVSEIIAGARQKK